MKKAVAQVNGARQWHKATVRGDSASTVGGAIIVADTPSLKSLSYCSVIC